MRLGAGTTVGGVGKPPSVVVAELARSECRTAGTGG